MEEESCSLIAAAFEETVIDTAKRCQQRHDSPATWAMEMSKCLNSCSSSSIVELGQVLVSYLCFQNNHPSLWKFLDYALSSNLLSPVHILSLLTARVFPHRRSQPQAFRLYLELLTRYALDLRPVGSYACNAKIIESVDVCLKFSQTYNVRVLDFGHVKVLLHLIDCLFEDMGLQVGSLDQQNMKIDSVGNFSVENNEHFEQIKRKNSLVVIEVLNKLMDSRKAMVLLRLVHFNI